MTRDWDAATYDRVSGPQVEFAERVLERLPLRGDETVLDAGVEDVRSRCAPELDYVRLNIDARRPA